MLRLLALEEIAPKTFRSNGENEGWNQVFGGQIVAQSLRAARLALPTSKRIASTHLTFISRAEVDAPLTYSVTETKSGSTFDRVQVSAEQGAEVRSIATVTFSGASEDGLEHQAPMPRVPAPAECADLASVARVYREYYPGDLPETDFQLPEQAVEARFVDPEGLLRPDNQAVTQEMWVRFSQPIPAEPGLHEATLGYISDQSIAHIALQPHPVGAFNPGLSLLRLDHGVVFFRPFQADDWLLLVRQCTSLSQGIASISGSFSSPDGSLVASLTQSAYLRFRA